MINDLKKDSEQRMQKTLESLEQGFAKVRTGRAHPSILNGDGSLLWFRCSIESGGERGC